MDIRLEHLIDLLKANEDFSNLDDSILEALAKKLNLGVVKSGEKVITEGAASDSMFILVSGRLRVSRQGEDGKLLLYNEVLPGDCVGETGLILEQARTADIIAMRDSVVATLDRAGYSALVKQYPIELNKVFSLAIYRHLRHQRVINERRRSQNFLLLSIGEEQITDEFLQRFETSLNRYGKSKVISSANINFSDVEKNNELNLDLLESQNDYLVFLGDHEDIDGCKQILNYADQVVFVADAEQSTDLTPIEKALSSEVGFDLIRKHLVLNYRQQQSECASRIEWQSLRDIERVYPVLCESDEDFGRVIRFLTGNAVGLVLGGGGARGFAHLGILKAFKEHNIPIDIVGGNSMGALIGACYAIGIPLEEIHEKILGHTKSGVKLTLPLISLMSNKSLEKAFRVELGEVNIENLWLPYFAAACNLSSAETTVLDNGPLWRAVLASNSPAGLFPPVVDNGELLVDGAILENVPVQGMRVRLSTKLERRRGNGKIIAIDVDLKDKLEVNKDLESLTNWNKLKSHFNSEQETIPGVVDILMQVAHIGGLTKRHTTKFASDLYLEPPLKQFSLMDYKKAEDIIEAGYHYAIEQIESWNWQN